MTGDLPGGLTAAALARLDDQQLTALTAAARAELAARHAAAVAQPCDHTSGCAGCAAIREARRRITRAGARHQGRPGPQTLTCLEALARLGGTATTSQVRAETGLTIVQARLALHGLARREVPAAVLAEPGRTGRGHPGLWQITPAGIAEAAI